MTSSSNSRHPRTNGRWRWSQVAPLSTVVLAAVLAACGGGGVGGQGTGTGLTASAYSQGSISGFGSIVVNGVHYDESTARITDDDGTALTAADLQRGMVVQIDSKNLDATALTATATAVQVASQLLGPVSAVADVSGVSTLTVLGQPVTVSLATVFDRSLPQGLASVAAGQVLEVHAIYDPVTGQYAARRVQLRSSASQYKIRGQIQSLNTSAGTFSIGSEPFVYSRSAPPAGLAEGATLRLKLQTTRDAQGRWQVVSGDRDGKQPGDGTGVEIEGVIASYTSLSQFTLAGLTVDASSAVLSPSTATLAAGKRVEVEGKMSGNVLKATKVELKGSDDSGSGSGSGSGGAQEFEVKGKILSLDTSQKTLVIRTATISYANASFSRGTAADLAVGKTLEVKGTLATGGTVVQASEVKFDD